MYWTRSGFREASCLWKLNVSRYVAFWRRFAVVYLSSSRRGLLTHSIIIGLQEKCLNETEWCSKDPTCSESPYQEPDATLKAGPIVGFVLLGVVILAIIAYFWHRHQLQMLEAKNRAVFARRIAETIQFTGSERLLTPEALAEEFHKIDEQTKANGKISKDELWAFLSTGKAGEITEHEFNALFAAMDLDGDGDVSFTEFISYFGQCEHEFDNVKNRQSVLDNRESRRDLLGKSATSLHSTRFENKPAETIPEEEAPKVEDA